MPSFIVRGRVLRLTEHDAIDAFMSIPGARWAEVEKRRDGDEYKVTIEFTRFHSDDDLVLREKGWEITPENLKKQIAAELQEAYDHGFLAGFFVIKEV